jgi:hypothetical protein
VGEWGHVKISRKAYAQDQWWLEIRVFSKWEAWEDCIQMASWKPRTFAIGFEIERLERGEFQASVRFLAARWRWAKWRVEKFLEVCQNRGRLQRQRNGHGGAIYLLVNYAKYQDNPTDERTPERTVDRTLNGHRTDKTEAVKQVNRKKQICLTPDEEAVIRHYRAQHPRRMRGQVPSRTLGLLRHALESYSVEELNRAIDANAASDYHRKGNFMDLSLIVRDSEHIDRFLGMAGATTNGITDEPDLHWVN